MASEAMQCPLCDFVVRARRHPKDSSIVEAAPQLLGHMMSTHKREVAERIERANRQAMAAGPAE